MKLSVKMYLTCILSLNMHCACLLYISVMFTGSIAWSFSVLFLKVGHYRDIIADIPKSLALKILKYLTPKDLAQASLVSICSKCTHCGQQYLCKTSISRYLLYFKTFGTYVEFHKNDDTCT